MITRPILVGSIASTSALVTLLDATMKSSFVVAFSMLLILALKKSTASLRHAILLGALCITIILPIVSWIAPRWSLLPSWLSLQEIPMAFFTHQSDVTTSSPRSHPVTTLTPEQPHITPKTSTSIPVTAGINEPKPAPQWHAAPMLRIWSIGSTLMLAAMFVSMWRLFQRRRSSITVSSGPLVEMLEKCRRELGYKKKISLRMDRGNLTPSCWGVVSPTIVLPYLAESWSPLRMRNVLLHEIAHLKRRDPLSLMIAYTALGLQWFNPLLWVIWHQLRKEQERACDDQVLMHGVKSSDYAEDMLDFAYASPQCAHSSMELCMARKTGIENRINEILDASRQRTNLSKRASYVLAGTTLFVCCLLGSLAAAPKKAVTRGSLKDRNGVILVSSTDGKRHNAFGALASHILGTTKQGSGRRGAEKTFDEALTNGDDVTLTIDARMQTICENILRSSGIGRGAVVVMNPSNGDILTMASVPNFEPHTFHNGISPNEMKDLYDNEASPLLNRATFNYSPGSVFKLYTALAACGKNFQTKKHTCNGYVTYGNHKAACWLWNQSQKNHGELDLPSALQCSCSPYFFQMSSAIGIEGFQKTARELGWDRPMYTQVDASSPRLSIFHAESRVVPIDLAFLSIGQGGNQASPLHIAQLTSVIANGGKVFLPRLDANGPLQMINDLTENGTKADSIAIIREGMRRTVQEAGGTASKLHSPQISIAAKTGTALEMDRGKKSTNAWCTAFAPVDNPKYVVTLLVVGGTSGGKVAAPITRSIIENLDATLPLHVQPANDGHLNPIDEIDE